MGEWREQQLCELVDISSSKRIFYNEYVSVGIPWIQLASATKLEVER